MFKHIPVIDIGDADTPAGLQRVVRELDAACRSAGFFYLAGHGVPPEFVARQFDWSARFFALPSAQKQALHLSHSPGHRGYEAVGDQRLDPAMNPDLKESFYCGAEYPDEHPFVRSGYTGYGHNQWPEQLLPGFRAQMLDYIGVMSVLGNRVMSLLAQALQLPADYFAALHTDPMVTLRLLRYPPHPADAQPADIGAGAHTDFGAITLLAQDELGGLEVLNPGGEWIAAAPIAGTFVVNLGDMVPRWTNNRYRSNLHRVINRNSSGRPRFSIPFFYGPRYDARIRCVPTCMPASGAPAWPECSAGEHHLEQYRKSYGKTIAARETA